MNQEHEIRIINERKWSWVVADVEDIRECSIVLYDQVVKDREGSRPKTTTTVIPKGGVTKRALKTIISSIPTNSSRKAYETWSDDSDDGDFGFCKLLELAVGCWQYNCCIHPDWETFSADVWVKWWKYFEHYNDDSYDRQMRQIPINWMFIALVFEWEDAFAMMYAPVILNYGKPSQDNVEELPDKFISLVYDTRRLETKKTYDYIRDSFFALWMPGTIPAPSMDNIHMYFETELRIDLRHPMRQDLHHAFDPYSLFDHFENIRNRNHNHEQHYIHPAPSEISQSVSQHAEINRKPIPPRMTVGLISAIGSTGKTLVGGAKNIVHRKRASRHDSVQSPRGSEEEWAKQSSVDPGNWRDKNLVEVPLRESEFWRLQKNYIRWPTKPQRILSCQPSVGEDSIEEVWDDQPSDLDPPVRPKKVPLQKERHSTGERTNGLKNSKAYTKEQVVNNEPLSGRSTDRSHRHLSRKPVNGHASDIWTKPDKT